MTVHDLSPVRSGGDADLPHYPQPREQGCPFAPPEQIRTLAAEKPLHRVRWWDGSTPWLVTGPAELRSLLTDSRVSADDVHYAVPSGAPPRRANRSGGPPPSSTPTETSIAATAGC